MFLAKNHSFKHVGGVFDRETGKKVAHSPSDAMRLLGKLYGSNVSPETFNTFEGALEWLMAIRQNKTRIEHLMLI